MRRQIMIFSGHVQGVGFRARVRELVRDVPVTGWVRNEADGTVRVELQGEGHDIEGVQMLIQDRLGGYVESCHEQVAPADPQEAGFEIKVEPATPHV